MSKCHESPYEARRRYRPHLPPKVFIVRNWERSSCRTIWKPMGQCGTVNIDPRGTTQVEDLGQYIWDSLDCTDDRAEGLGGNVDVRS